MDIQNTPISSSHPLAVGLLWFDNTPSRSLEEKILAAVERYREKFGHVPDTCCVHPGAIDGELQLNGLRVVAARHVLVNHFFVGVAR